MTEEVRTTTRELFCALTEAEVGAKAADLARITTQLSELEDEKKAIGSSFKDKIDRCVVDSRSLARKVSERRELRTVECRWVFEYQVGRAYLKRTDTGEVIEERPLTAEERQPSLPIGEGDGAKACRVCGCTEEKACELGLSKEYMCNFVEGEDPPLCDNPACCRTAGKTEEEIRKYWADAIPEEKMDEVLNEKTADAPAAEKETPQGDGPVFVDDLGRHCQVLRVNDPGTGRDRWGAFRVKKSGGTILIKQVPRYAERANAEKGLVAFAQKAGFLTLAQHEELQAKKEAANG